MKGMRKYLALTIVMICSFTMNAYAVDAGFYMGLMFGTATNGGKDQNINLTSGAVFRPNTSCIGNNFNVNLPCCKKTCTQGCQSCVYVPPVFGEVIKATPRSQQYGGRIFIGNQINSIVSFEGGLTLFSNINYRPKIDVPSNPSATARVRSFDIVVKGAIPFRNIADIYAKAGVAVTYLTLSGGLNQSGQGTFKTSLRPTFSLGGTYDFNQNWVADVSYTYLQVGNIVKNVNFFAVGFSYHFVNRYCGQFLCDD